MPFKPILLTAEEEKLFSSMVFEGFDSESYATNAIAAERLMELLNSRAAIPSYRLSCFDDANYRRGRRKGSWREIIEKNGEKGECVYRNHVFWGFIKYFVLGPDLPDALMSEYSLELEGRSPISSEDVLELVVLAKKLIRKYDLVSVSKADELFRLCIDCGMYVGYASRIRDNLSSVH